MKRIKEFIVKNKKELLAYILIFLVLGIIYMTIHCPFRFFAGISCPGCGMTRALSALSRLRFKEALYCHPGVFILPLVFAVIFLRKKLSKKTRNFLIIFICLVFGSIYIYRLLSGSEIVYVDFSSGLIYKIISDLKSI